jgi:glycyl-tRNA synthetase
LLQSEIEHCRYYFEVADVDAITTIYDAYEREAQRCLAAGLVMPAHDYNLKCSHLFNVMDARGAIGVTERANYFRRMRNISVHVAQLYLEQRQRLEYPFLRTWSTEEVQTVEPELRFTQLLNPHTFLLEIGSEELPVGDLTSAIRQLEARMPELLHTLRLSYEGLEVHGTPRRIVITVEQLSGSQEDVATTVKGPPLDRAFDADGNPTRAAHGFARSKGLGADELKIVDDGKKRYVAVVVHEKGRPAADVLAETLPELLAGIKFDRSMRWNSSNVAYSRPLRWIVALYGPDILRFSYAGVHSGRVSRGLRPQGSPAIEIDDASNYEAIVRKHGIIVSVKKREELIMTVASRLAAEKRGTIRQGKALLDEVTNLVERPTPLRGRFEERFLRLPDEVLVAVMRKHQRYFPVYANSGRLLPYFIAVRNGDDRHLDKVVDGNEHVIRARFADAEFFYNHDKKRSISDFLADLDGLSFQAELGSMREKTRRLQKLTPVIAEMLGLSEAETAVAARAAALSKADLVSKMVVEMTSLQGIMGGHYARLNGEPDEVAAAIEEQYNPVSTTRPGLALALADRFDSLVGLFEVGLAPKGSNDPFALRRAALHIIENLVANQIEFDLRAGFAAAVSFLPLNSSQDTVQLVLAFVNGRLESLLREQGFAANVVKSVLAEQGHNPYGASRTTRLLSEAVAAPDWSELLDAYARCVRIIRNLDTRYSLRFKAFTHEAEEALYAAYQEAVSTADGTLSTFVSSLRQMVPAISRFFDDVLVMDEDEELRHNRLALLQHVADMAKGIADLSWLEGF